MNQELIQMIFLNYLRNKMKRYHCKICDVELGINYKERHEKGKEHLDNIPKKVLYI